MKKQYRTSWTVDNLADWLSRYDEIHKAGTMREPYDYKTWQLIVQDVALDYADIVRKKKDKTTKMLENQIQMMWQGFEEGISVDEMNARIFGQEEE